MSSIKFKDVVSFSSQDPIHRVFNLLEQKNQFKRWLCAPDDKTGKLQAEFQLEKASKIGFVDIGNYGSAFVEIQVRRSSWPEGKSVTMIPASMMMNPQQCKTGKNKCSVKMFTKDQLTTESVEDSWDRVKVICTQPYKKDAQFGLAFIRLAAAATETSALSPEAPGPTMMKLAGTSPFHQPVPAVRKPAGRPILSPSWKTNAAFHRQVIAVTKKEDTNDVGLKTRLLKISSTSENGSDKEAGLGRSARLVMAAAVAATGKKPSSSDRKETSPGIATDTTTASAENTGVEALRGPNVENTDMDKPFSDLVVDFLSTMSDDKLKHSTLKAIRTEFEQFIGRKLTIPEKAELKGKAIVAVGQLVVEDRPSSSSKSTPNTAIPKSPSSQKLILNVSTPKSRGTQSQHDKIMYAGISPDKPYTKYLSENVSTGTKVGNNYELNNTKVTPSTKTSVGNSKKVSSMMYPPNQQDKRKSPTTLLNSRSHKLAGNYTYGGNRNNYKSPSGMNKTASHPDHRHLPKSQKKRPASPSWHEQYLKTDKDNHGNKKARTHQNSPTEDGDGWLQVERPTTSAIPSATSSTTSTFKAPPGRNVPAWMAAGVSSPSSNVTPSKGRGRGGTGASKGERKPCPKCNKTFTAVGVGRHMAKCTGPKQRKQSRGRGRGGKNMEENTPKQSSPGTSSTTEETGSPFGLTTTDLVTCPMCTKDFPVMLIELHADMCANGGADNDVMVYGAGAQDVDFPFNPIWIG